MKDMNASISHVAGLVIKTLEDKRRPMSLLELSLRLRVWPWEVALALGWLSRNREVEVWVNVFALMAEKKQTP